MQVQGAQKVLPGLTLKHVEDYGSDNNLLDLVGKNKVKDSDDEDDD